MCHSALPPPPNYKRTCYGRTHYISLPATTSPDYGRTSYSQTILPISGPNLAPLVSRYSLNVEENVIQIQTLFRVLFMKCELIKSKLAWQVNLTNNEKFRTKSGKNWSSHNNHQPLNRNYHIKGENPWIGLLLFIYFQFEGAWHLEVLKSILMLTLSQMVGG